MMKLLHSDLSRLWKSKLLRFSLALMLIVGIYIPLHIVSINHYYMVDGQLVRAYPLDDSLFNFVSYIPFVVAAFCSLFIGTEYSDGTIRNKLIVGHKRQNVYLSNFITTLLAAFLMLAVYFLSQVILILCLGGFSMTVRDIALNLLVTVGAILAVTAIFTAIAMLIHNKAAVAIICLIGFFALLAVGGGMLESQLAEPEYLTTCEWTIDGFPQMITTDEKNPEYLEGTARNVVQFLYDANPGGQLVQVYTHEAKNHGRMIACSLALTVCVSALGIISFRKKDLK